MGSTPAFRPCAFATAALLLPLGLVGCAIDSARFPESSAVGVKGSALEGSVHGGQQPIVGSHVFLLAANTTGYGSASVSLLTTNSNTTLDSTAGSPTKGFYYVTTDAGGAFSIGGDYTCPSNSPQVYLYAVGGNPGGGVANSAAGALAALGTCPAGATLATASPAISFISMNEISTVAAAYAMSGFATDALHVSSSGTTLAVTGITNAFKNATNLADLASGVALTTTPVANGGNGTVPQTMIDTLANILASCINSTGPSGVGCSTLLPTATSDGTSSGTRPTDTATAAINIAHHPASNLTALYGLQVAAAPFQPSLTGTSPPNDFTLTLSFTAGGLSQSTGLAIDGNGNVWIANRGSNKVTELSSVGLALSGATGYTSTTLNGPSAIAIDNSGDAWVANAFDNVVTELSASGAIVSGSGYTTGGFDGADGIAIDAAGDAWVAYYYSNYNHSPVFKLSSTGSPLSGTGGYALDDPDDVGGQGIAIDATGNTWVAPESSSKAVKLSASGTATLYPGLNSGSLGVAIDASGNIWFTNGSGLAKFSNSGSALTSGSGYTGGGLNGPYYIAIDGNGNVFVPDEANSSKSELSEFTNGGAAISPSTGYYGANTSTNGSAYAAGVDGSGNVWTSNYNGSGTVTEFVGLATPVVTPLVAGVIGSKIATRP